jgi:hypothetical protein
MPCEKKDRTSAKAESNNEKPKGEYENIVFECGLMRVMGGPITE